MPPSARRTRGRREAELLQQSDAETPESIPTPTRKRRRLNGAANTVARNGRARRSPSQQTEGTIDNQYEDEAAPQTPTALADAVIRHLKTASYEVRVAVDHANQMHNHNELAYARISGRHWTYFVRKLEINIGRPVKERERLSAGDATGAQPNSGPKASWDIDIDLGPEQQVSRLHAQIMFHQDTAKWVVSVNGRNGLKLDDQTLKRGETAYLHSGSVITIMGTQMMFLLPEGNVDIHPSFLRQSSVGGRTDSEPEDEEELQPRGLPGSASRNQNLALPGSFQQSSQTRNQIPNQQIMHSYQATAGYPGTPATARARENQAKPKPSPAYARGLMLESTEEIDYSLDSAKDLKPPHSYAQLIGQAILSSPEEKVTLAKIYEYIKERYAFYRFSGGGWQNSIRHNLSLNKCFEKVARRTDEPGKGMKWQIVAEHRDEFLKKSLSGSRRGMHRLGSSGPNSPATRDVHPVQATQRLMGVISPKGSPRQPAYHAPEPRPKRSSRSATPPLASYPTANVSFTPDRGPRPPQIRTDHLPPLNGDQTHTPDYDHSQASSANPILSANSITRGLTEAATRSPPTLSSSMFDLQGNSALFTPFVARHHPRLAPPSTARLPSQFIVMSSPAPFWKYMDLGSTPAKPPNLDLSPVKMGKEGDDIDGDDVEDVDGADEDGLRRGEGAVQSSSPPPMLDGIGSTGDISPTRTISRPVSRREAPRLNLSNAPVLSANGNLNLDGGRLSGGMNGLPNGINGNAVANTNVMEDDDEGGIDLAKGFQKIGSFHLGFSQRGTQPRVGV